ncbi:Lsr2 family protein [Curtobacterium aetherium]|uniref:Lsr2 family protein n=1 Tax=Curtobacterium aetherium TaxID=2841594 RepID=A0ACD1E636_9MICO|nr:Lsr2 family protein [Curtobacterium sp. L6-1]QWS34298.1 Lsr2 family protein [Curtobacterium sp. L6-1]
MAQKVTVQLVDDLDDSPIAAGDGRTVEFAFDGSSYEIDLSNDNVDKFRDAISDYIAAARKTAGRRTGSTGKASGSGSPKRGNSEELGKIREWAKENGYEVSSRGRISTQVQEAYAAAH